jgi:uncharacterized protein YjbI with pentapeptide repeats
MAAYPDFTGVDFSGCSLFSVSLNQTTWTNANLSGASWVNVQGNWLILAGANMANMSVKGSYLIAPTVGGGLTGANVTGVNFAQAASFTMGGYGVQGAGSATFPATKAVVQDDSYGTVIFGNGVQVPYISLQGLNLNGKVLGSSVNLHHANLTGTNLNGATLTGSNLTGVTLTGATFIGATLTGTTFDDSFNFTGPLDDSAMQEVFFDGAQLNGADFSGMNLTNAVLGNGSLQGANFSGTNLNGVNLINSQMQGANFSGANLTSAEIQFVNLTGANLTGANLTGANFNGSTRTGVTLNAQTLCKNGFAYLSNGNSTVNDCLDGVVGAG